jgi:hypothetical protein
MRKLVIFTVVVFFVSAALLSVQGCTFQFKASEVEASGYGDMRLELESVDFLVCQDTE